MLRIKHALLALTVVSGLAVAAPPQHQIFSCEISSSERVYATLDNGFITYHYQDDEDRKNDASYPRTKTNKPISIYHDTAGLIDGTPIETIRLSFHLSDPQVAMTTILSMDMSPNRRAFAIPSIQIMIDGRLQRLIACEHDSNAIYDMRDALKGQTIAAGYSVDKIDPIRPE